MTIEDFDKKQKARNTIKYIDDILECYNSDPDSVECVGINVLYSSCVVSLKLTVNDEVLIEQFKEMLINRKKQLIKENFDTE